eukprot:235617_1
MPWLCFYTISYILLITIIILAMDFSINDNQEAFLKINLFQNNNDRNITSNTTSNATSNTSIESNEPNQSHQNTHNELNMSSQIFNQHNTNTHENITTTSILSQNMFHMNNSLHAQQNLIIQAELLKQKRLKIKRKRAQTNPSEDINKFYHDLNHKQKGMVNIFLIDSMNDNQSSINFTVRQYFQNRLIANGSTRECLGCVIGSPLNGICGLCYGVTDKKTHIGCRECGRIYNYTLHDFIHGHIQKKHPGKYKISIAEFLHRMTKIQHIDSLLPLKYISNRPFDDISTMPNAKKRIRKKAKLNKKDLAQINEQIKNNEMNYINNSSSNINDFNISNNNNTNNSLNIPSIPDLPETVNTNNKTNINAEKRALPRVSPCEKYTNQILRISQEKYKRRITGMDIINQYNRKYRIQNHNNITSIVTVGKLNNCSCDEWKDDVCDEFVWTLIKALKVPINSYLVYQKAFLEHELTQIFNNAPKLLESICGPLSQPKTQPSIIEHNTSHTGHGFFRNNKKRGRDEGKRQKLNNGSVKIMPNNPNIPYSTRDLMFKQLYGYNQYQMSNISDKGIFENDELQNNKKNNSQNYIHQSNKLSFTINELNEYKNTNKQICLSKDELDKYHWGSINQLCGVLKLTRGGKKKDMISRIMESKFYGK